MRMFRNRAALCILGLGLFAAPSASAQGNGNITPFEVGLSALLNKDGSVDLHVGVNVKPEDYPAYIAPTESKHIQLKSYDLEGKLRWTRNYQDQQLRPEPDYRAASTLFRYDDMVHRQPVKAEVQIQNQQTTNTEGLRGFVEVLLRPDPVLTAIQAPEEVPIGTPIEVAVTVNERNKDLPATADIALYDGAIELMRMSGALIEPEGPTVVRFQDVTLYSVGDHTLRAVIENAEPADFDGSNNEMETIVTVNDGGAIIADTMVSYAHRDYREIREWDTAYRREIQEDVYVDQDSFGVIMFTGPDTVRFPVDFSYTIEADGMVFATDDLLGLQSNYHAWVTYVSYRSSLGGQQIEIRSYEPSPVPNGDFVQFLNLASTNVYKVTLEDTDGDGDLEITSEYEEGPFGSPIATDAPPSSLAASLELASAGLTYRGEISGSASEILVECPPDYGFARGTRGLDYVSVSVVYEDCFFFQKNNWDPVPPQN